MNLKHLDKVWRESCPDEVNGMIKKKSMPKRWLLKIQTYNNKKKQKEKLLQEKS
tara:strand:+ start:87 stop:248 length:162 start_codon:yes stop_codon:yes gene_type:complete